MATIKEDRPTRKGDQRPRSRKARAPDDVVQLSIRIHFEARRQLRIRSAEEDIPMEEIVRSLLYPTLGLDHLPVVVEPEDGARKVATTS